MNCPVGSKIVDLILDCCKVEFDARILAHACNIMAVTPSRGGIARGLGEIILAMNGCCNTISCGFVLALKLVDNKGNVVVVIIGARSSGLDYNYSPFFPILV